MPKQKRELWLVGMYVWGERRWIIVGNKRHKVQVSSVKIECRYYRTPLLLKQFADSFSSSQELIGFDDLKFCFIQIFFCLQSLPPPMSSATSSAVIAGMKNSKHGIYFGKMDDQETICCELASQVQLRDKATFS